MTPERDRLWTVIEARDAAVADLASARRSRDALLDEKERVIAELRDGELGRKQQAIEVLEAEVRVRDEALKALEADLHTRDQALKAKELLIEQLKADLREKEAIRKLNATLEEKEAVIYEQRRAIQAYRATYAVLGIFIVPLNHLVLGVRSLFRRTIGLATPRLGVLYQHAPVAMRLPADYAATPMPATTPRISIVTPSFRQARFIERTIRSVVEQGYPNLEYHVQDGGSRDGTVEILERYSPRITSWESEPDSGQSQAINRAFAKTSGEIMAWLNSDDILLPGVLAYVADYFNRNPDVDVVYGHRILIDEEDREIGRWILPPHEDKVLSWADYVPQETLFWRRRIWDKVDSRIDESFRFAMDWVLLLRFRGAGARFARLPRFLGGFRVHPEQKTTADISDLGFKEMNLLRERSLGHVPTGLEVRKAVIPYLLRHTVTDIGWRIRNRLGTAT
jgi:glycosyltransferase involved in cell wall biosynthesis